MPAANDDAYSVQKFLNGYAIVWWEDCGDGPKRRRLRLAATDRESAKAEARKRWEGGDDSPWTVGRCMTGEGREAMCDCEVPQAYRDEWRTARKSHRCCECAAWITPKERYFFVSGIWDHRPGSFRTCVQCVQVRDWYVAELIDRWDCAPCFGQLYDDMPREDWPPHTIAAQAALRAERRAA